ncbi:hypothetical protein [Pseudomonas sp. RIT-To-2]|uniref:hypothetical protein n=1 Tax=Pseudomonas sp. RIT-To-2 TaxID=3462541 RepID=UPI002413C654
MTQVLKGPYRQHGFWWVDVKCDRKVKHKMYSSQEIAQAAVDRWLAGTGAMAVTGKAQAGQESV